MLLYRKALQGQSCLRNIWLCCIKFYVAMQVKEAHEPQRMSNAVRSTSTNWFLI